MTVFLVNVGSPIYQYLVTWELLLKPGVLIRRYETKPSGLDPRYRVLSNPVIDNVGVAKM